MLGSKSTLSLLCKNTQKYVNNKQFLNQMIYHSNPLTFRYFCNSKDINYDHPTVKYTDAPTTREVDISGVTYTQHRDDIHGFDEMKYKEMWTNPYNTIKKRIISKSVADDRYLFDQKIIPKKQLMSAYYSVEKEGKVYHVFNAANIYWRDMVYKISVLIRGKQKPIYKSCNADNGDTIIVVNLTQLKMPGKMLRDLKLHYHTGWVGGMQEKYYRKLVFKKPEMLLFKDVHRALPKNDLRHTLLKNLKAYRGPHHNYKSFLPHFAERPPVDKISLLPDGHFEDVVDKIREGKGEQEGWGGSAEYDFHSYNKDVELETGETVSARHVEKKSEVKKYKSRVRQYFQYLRRTDDYVVKKKVSKYEKFKQGKEGYKPFVHVFHSEKQVRNYKEDWILKQGEQDSSGED